MKRNIFNKNLQAFMAVLILSYISISAQNNLRTMVAVDVIPNRPGWNYKLGEKAIFNVEISESLSIILKFAMNWVLKRCLPLKRKL